MRENQQTPENEREKQVEAEMLKHTSVAGMMMQRGARYMLPLSLAKSLRDQGLARPVPKAAPSHPSPPPPPPDPFDGEGEDSEEDEE